MLDAIDVLDQMVELEFAPPEGGVHSNPNWTVSWRSFSGVPFTVQVEQTDDGFSVACGQSSILLAADEYNQIIITKVTPFGQTNIALPLTAHELEIALEDGGWNDMFMTAIDCLVQSVFQRTYSLVVDDTNGVKPEVTARQLIEDAAIDGNTAVARMSTLAKALSLVGSSLVTLPEESWQDAATAMNLLPPKASDPDSMIYFQGKCIVIRSQNGSLSLDHFGMNTNYRVQFKVDGNQVIIELCSYDFFPDKAEVIADAKISADALKTGAWKQVYPKLGLESNSPHTQGLLVRCGLERFQRAIQHTEESIAA